MITLKKGAFANFAKASFLNIVQICASISVHKADFNFFGENFAEFIEKFNKNKKNAYKNACKTGKNQEKYLKIVYNAQK